VKVIQTPLPGVLVIEPKIWQDHRGFFLESFNESLMSEAGISGPFVQDNHSRSKRNVLRGLHYQVERPQGKLVRVVRGSVFDVAVDIREGSATFGKWFGITLDGDSLKMLWVPPGFAHGYLVLSDSADFLYKTTDFYFPQHERTILYDDPKIGIAWPGDSRDYLLSDKDKAGSRFQAAQVYP
jgi:dTDP-4-dehydrorhamnose 3,5-epimerase